MLIMYNNLMKGLKKGYQCLSVSARCLGTSARTALTFSEKVLKTRALTSNTSDCSSTEALTVDTSIERISDEGFVDEDFLIEKHTDESETSDDSKSKLWCDSCDSLNCQENRTNIEASFGYPEVSENCTHTLTSNKMVCDNEFNNKLKMDLASRLARDLLSPYVNQIVAQIHSQGPHNDVMKEEFTQKDVDECINGTFGTSVSTVVHKWIKYVKELHVNAGNRCTPSIQQIKTWSDVRKWPTDTGAWEIAKVFMHEEDHFMKSRNDASELELTLLLEFICNCNFTSKDFAAESLGKMEKTLCELKDSINGNALFKLTNEKMNSQFECILELLQDEDVLRHVNQHRQPSIKVEGIKDVLPKIKEANFFFVPETKSPTTILQDKVPLPSSENSQRMNDTIRLSQKAFSQTFCECPEAIHNSSKIEILISVTEEKEIADCEDDKTIKEMSAHVLEQNRELDRLRSCIKEMEQSRNHLAGPALTNRTEETLEYVLANEPNQFPLSLFEHILPSQNSQTCPPLIAPNLSEIVMHKSNVDSEKVQIETKKRKADSCSEKSCEIPAKRKQTRN